MTASAQLWALGQTAPEVLRLAEEVSLAVMVDAGLLRRVRLCHVPEATAATEADLWFSPLVRSRSADGFVLEPRAAALLRRRLAVSPGRLQRARDVTAEAHAHLSPLLQLEEELLWLSVRGNDAGTRERITQVLRSALVSLVRDGRSGVASWAARALPGLPAEVRGSEAAAMLAAGAALRLGGTAGPLLQSDGAELPDWSSWLLPDELPRQTLHVRLLDDGVEVHALESGPGKPVPVPATEPLVLELAWPATGESHRLAIRPNEGIVVPAQVPVRVRTLLGEEFELNRVVPGVPATITGFDALGERINRIADEAGAQRVAVAWYDYETRSAWNLHGDEWFQASHLIQLAVLMGVFGASYLGRVTLDSRVHVNNRFFSAVDGKPYRVTIDRQSEVGRALGRTLKINDLAYHMIVTGDVLATNLLLDLVGVDETRASLREFGVSGVDLRRGMDDERAWEAGLNNRITANGVISILRPVEEGTAFDVEVSARMLEILHDQEKRGGIPAGVPEGARVANITGAASTVSHDAAIVYLPGRKPYIVAVLTQWEPGASGRQDTLARVSKVVYEHFVSGDVEDPRARGK